MSALLRDWVILNRRRIIAWFQDDVFRRLFVNAGKLLSANAVAAVLGLTTAIMTARSLGPERYGILSLVFAYELTIGKLVTFNAWQAVIKFGSEALHANDRPALRQLIKFGFCLDLGGAIVGTLIAVLLAGPVIALLGWDQSVRPLLVLYSVMILFTISGTPIGILRLFNRFDVLGYAVILSAVIRLAGVAWCLFTKQGLLGFVLVHLIAGIAGQFYQALVSIWVLREQGIRNVAYEPLEGIRSRFHGILDYVWMTNLTMTVRMLSREADGLFIAALTTPAALGLYRVAKQFSLVMPKLSDPLSQSIYPELSWAWTRARRGRFFSLIRRATLITGTVALTGWLMFLLFGRWAIHITVGSEFKDAYWVTVVYLLAMVVFLFSFALTPAMLAIGLARQSFFANLVATALYFVLLFPLVQYLGIAGASLAYVGYFLIWSGIMLLCLQTFLRNRTESMDALDRPEEQTTHDCP